MEVILNLPEDGVVALARDGKGVFSRKIKRNDLKRILAIAAENFNELANLWEEIHGEGGGSGKRSAGGTH